MIENGTEKAASFVILFLEGENKIKNPILDLQGKAVC
jgi:hypothetical protein